jgi:hypothetical protein
MPARRAAFLEKAGESAIRRGRLSRPFHFKLERQSARMRGEFVDKRARPCSGKNTLSGS